MGTWTDAFSGGDADLAAPWVNLNGPAVLEIVAHQVQSRTGGNGAARYGGTGIGGAQYASIVFIADTSGGAEYGVLARADNTGAYMFCYNTFSGNFRLVHYIWGVSETELNGGDCHAAGAIAANDVLRIKANGTSIVGKKNGIIILSTTDVVLATGDGGILIGTPAPTGILGPNFTMGDLDAGAGVVSGGTSTVAVIASKLGARAITAAAVAAVTLAGGLIRPLALVGPAQGQATVVVTAMYIGHHYLTALAAGSAAVLAQYRGIHPQAVTIAGVAAVTVQEAKQRQRAVTAGGQAAVHLYWTGQSSVATTMPALGLDTPLKFGRRGL